MSKMAFVLVLPLCAAVVSGCGELASIDDPDPTELDATQRARVQLGHDLFFDDKGRFEVTGDPADEMVFVVPSLRNVSETGPWFHDGSVETLEEAVRLMARHQLDRTFTRAQERALVAFLGTMTAQEVQPWAFEDWALSPE